MCLSVWLSTTFPAELMLISLSVIHYGLLFNHRQPIRHLFYQSKTNPRRGHGQFRKHLSAKLLASFLQKHGQYNGKAIKANFVKQI
jgi:hypothetical protein